MPKGSVPGPGPCSVGHHRLLPGDPDSVDDHLCPWHVSPGQVGRSVAVSGPTSVFGTSPDVGRAVW